MSEDNALQIPILSQLLGRDVPRSRFLVALFEASTDWPALALTIAAGVLRQGHVVNFVAVSEPPDEVRRALQSEVPNLTELEKNKKFWLYDWHTWMTGKKSDDPFAVDSLSVAKLSADVPIFWRDYSPIFDFAIVDKRIDDTQV